MNTNMNTNDNNNANMTSETEVADLEKQVQCLKLRGCVDAKSEDADVQPAGATAAVTKIQMALRRWRRLSKHGGRKAPGVGCPRRARCALRLRVINAKLAREYLPESKRVLLEQSRDKLMARLSSRPPHATHGKGKGKGGGMAGGPKVRLAVLEERLAKVAARLVGEELSADERLALTLRQDEIAGRIKHVKERLAHGKGPGHHGKGFGKGHHGKGHHGKGHHGKGHRGKGIGPLSMEDDDDCDFLLVEPNNLCPERGMGPDKLPEGDDEGSDSSDDESDFETEAGHLPIPVGEGCSRFFHGKGGKGEGFHGKGGKGEGFHGKGGKGEGFHGKGHGKGEGFHGKGGKGEGFHGKGGKGEGFHGKGHGKGEGFHGKGGKGEGFHGMGHGKGEGFHGKGGKGEGIHGKGEGFHGKGEGFHGKGEGFHGKGEGFHGKDAPGSGAPGGFPLHDINGDY